MIDKEIRSLFDSVDASSALLRRTESRICKSHFEKRKPVKRIACIALAAVLLVSAASAAVKRSGILDRLFQKDKVPQSIIEAVVVSPCRTTKDGLTLNFDEYLSDRETLHAGWTVTSDREKDVYFTTGYKLKYTDESDQAMAENSIGGTFGECSSSEIGDGAMVHLCKETPSYSGWLDSSYLKPLTHPVLLEISIWAYESDLTPVKIENAMDVIYEEDNPLVAELESKGQIGVDPNQLTGIANYTAVKEANSKNPSTDNTDEDQRQHESLVASGFMKPIAELSLEVTIDPKTAATSRFHLEKELSFRLPERTVLFRKLDLNASSTLMEYEIISGDSQETEYRYLVFDQDGNCLNADYSMNMSIQPTEAGCLVFVNGLPLPETVITLHFVPFAPLARDKNEPSNSYYQRMAKCADSDDCFSVDLTVDEN